MHSGPTFYIKMYVIGPTRTELLHQQVDQYVTGLRSVHKSVVGESCLKMFRSKSVTNTGQNKAESLDVL
jgi:hypothetical protein